MLVKLSKKLIITLLIAVTSFFSGCSTAPSLGAIEPTNSVKAPKSTEDWTVSLAKKYNYDIQRIIIAECRLIDDCECKKFYNWEKWKKKKNEKINFSRETEIKDSMYCLSGNDSEDRKVFERRIFVQGMFELTDLYHGSFLNHLRTERVASDTFFETAVIGVGAAGALLTGGISQVLAGTAAAITGFHSSVAKNAFNDQTIAALLAQIDANRAIARTKIVNELKKPLSEYSLPEARVDLLAYLYSGALSKAYVAIEATSNMAKVEAEKALSDAEAEEKAEPAGGITEPVAGDAKPAAGGARLQKEMPSLQQEMPSLQQEMPSLQQEMPSLQQEMLGLRIKGAGSELPPQIPTNSASHSMAWKLAFKSKP